MKTRNLFFYFSLLIIAISCDNNKKYTDEIKIISSIIEANKNISIGNRGELKEVEFKMNDTSLFKYMTYNKVANVYVFKEKFSDSDLKILNYIIKNDTGLVLNKSDLINVTENRINKIISTCKKANIIASNCLEEKDECIDCVFWYNIDKRLFYFKDTACVIPLQLNSKIIHKQNNWIVVDK